MSMTTYDTRDPSPNPDYWLPCEHRVPGRGCQVCFPRPRARPLPAPEPTCDDCGKVLDFEPKYGKPRLCSECR